MVVKGNELIGLTFQFFTDLPNSLVIVHLYPHRRHYHHHRRHHYQHHHHHHYHHDHHLDRLLS